MVNGPDVAGMKGKNTRRKPELVGEIEVIPLPPDVLKHHKNTMISADYVYVHGLAHFHAISRGYCHRIEKYVNGKKPTKRDSISCVKGVINKYKERGIGIKQINADNEFECVRENVRPVKMNIVGAGEQIGDIL